MTENELFYEVLKRFQAKYPSRNIELKNSTWGTFVHIDGEEKFNISGYNLLYNLRRLCRELEDELL